MRGLQRLGVHFSQRQIDGVLHTWHYVGHLFGLDANALVNTEEEAEKMVQVGKSLEFDADEISRKLCQAMIDGGPTFLKALDKRMLLFRTALYPISRYLLGNHLADELGIPKGKRLLLCYGFILLIRFSRRFPKLAPRAYRDFAGIHFWLECSDYPELR